MTIRNTTLLFAFVFAGLAECDAYPLSLLDAEASASTQSRADDDRPDVEEREAP